MLRQKNRIPGVLDYYGYDEEADKLIYVHAHYLLILGHDMTNNYRLLIESLYLESTVQGDLFNVPVPEFDYLFNSVLVKYTTKAGCMVLLSFSALPLNEGISVWNSFRVVFLQRCPNHK